MGKKLNLFLGIMQQGKQEIEKIVGREIEFHEDMDEVLKETLKKQTEERSHPHN